MNNDQIEEAVDKIIDRYGVALTMLGLELDKETADIVFKVLDAHKKVLQKRLKDLNDIKIDGDSYVELEECLRAIDY